MTPQPDFLRPVRGPHRLAWLACATAVAVLGVATLDAWEAWETLQAPPPRARALPAVLAPAPAAPETRRSLEQALARLARPWAEDFAALDAIRTPGVAWLALEIGDNGRLRLQGVAADTGAAIAAADALRRQGHWREVLLGRMDSAAGGRLRFDISAEAAP